MTRRTRHPDLRPPSWKRLGWQDAPGALAPQPVAGAAIAEPGSVPDTLRQYWVHVCSVRGRLVAYTTDAYQGVESAACRHGVSACSGDAAKAAAIAEHRERCAR